MNSNAISSTREQMKTTFVPLATALFLALSVLFGSATLAHAQTADFSITASPLEVCVNPGGTGYYSTTVSSTDGFQGSVSLGDTVDPSSANSPAVNVPSSVSLTAGQSQTFYTSASTTSSTPTGTYTITIVGESGDTLHYTTVYLAVQSLCPALGGTVAPSITSGLLIALATIGAGLTGLAAGTAFLFKRRSRPL